MYNIQQSTQKTMIAIGKESSQLNACNLSFYMDTL